MKGVLNVKISLTTNALEKLKKIDIQPPKGIRVHASMSSGWSSTAKFDLVLDEPKEDDEDNIVSDLLFYLPPDTIRLMEEKIILDYNPTYGYVIKTANEILQFGVKLQT